jgi:choline kinase
MITEEYKVILTTSGIGNRLGDLTKFTNKSLVRIGKKPAISYIIESYPKDIEFVVTLGYYGNYVSQFLKLAYPEHKFTFVNVDKYEGDGSSLLYSLLQAKEYLQCPFIFHACDSILEDEIIPKPDKNWLGGYKKTNTSHYRTYNINNGYVSKLNDKGEISYDFEYIGVCGINNYIEFWNKAEEKYNSYLYDTSLSDCHVIENMLNDNKFESVVFNKWLDIGNTSELKKAREYIKDKFNILDKLEESIFIFDSFVIKFFNDSNINLNRVDRVNYLNNLTPEIIDYTENFYKYKYIDGNLFSESVNIIKFNKFLNWSNNNLWKKYDIDLGKFKNICYEFYYTKTQNRISKFLIENNLIDKEENINGIIIPSINNLLKQINFNWLCDVEPYNFHGDFILDNIIEKDNKFTLLDWRQDFGGLIECGDMNYDIAKLNHNLFINHDIINNNMFSIKKESNYIIKCNILYKSELIECKKILDKFILNNGLNINKINILTSLIWLNMSPLHHYPFNQFLFYWGKYNLNKALLEYYE